jgi:uncharacterized OB-fold protein
MRDDDFFWEGAKAHRLLVQRCEACDRLHHPPVALCPECHGSALSPVECSGRGEIAGWVASKHPTRPDEEVRIVAVIALEEGVRMVSNLQDVELSAVQAGLPVEVCFKAFGDTVLPQFRPAGAR